MAEKIIFSVVCQTKKTGPKVGCIKCTALTQTAIMRFALPAVNVCVGGVSLDVLIDSGCTHNIVDEHTWAALKENVIECTSSVNPTGKQLYICIKPTTDNQRNTWLHCSGREHNCTGVVLCYTGQGNRFDRQRNSDNIGNA